MLESKPNRNALKERQKRLKQFQREKTFAAVLFIKKVFGWFFKEKFHYLTFFLIGLIFSLLPNISEVFSENTTQIELGSNYILFEEEESSPLSNISDEGFLGKVIVPTEESNKRKLTDIFDYQIQSGDTLSGIANRFGISVQTVMEVNNLTKSHLLRIGDTLTIIPVDGLLHTVKKEDTVKEIAENYKVEEKEVVLQNKLSGINVALVPGTKLIVPGATKPKPKAPPVPVRTSTVASLRSAQPKVSAPSPATVTIDPKNLKLQSPVFGGIITQGYSYRHRAIDIGSKQGRKTGIYTAASGVVETATTGGWNGGYGNYIIINHGKGVKTLYAHNDSILVKVGDTVKAGQLIAKMGNTGRTYGVTGIHLHFEVIINNQKVDPMKYL